MHAPPNVNKKRENEPFRDDGSQLAVQMLIGGDEFSRKFHGFWELSGIGGGFGAFLVKNLYSGISREQVEPRSRK